MPPALNDSGSRPRRWNSLESLSAAIAIVLFVVLQAATLDYGLTINDLPHIRDYRIASDVVSGSGLDRPGLVGFNTGRGETLDLAMVRFKLYTVDADEANNVIALARIRPASLNFDPGYYQYGGAYLYPLGAWYFALSRLGIVQVGTFQDMLANPGWIDRVWIAGRAFVLLSVALSGIVLFMTLVRISSPGTALAGLAIYLFCPATITFSQVLKPHWYALLWVNIALLVIVRSIQRGGFTLRAELALAASLGLAVGSALTFGLFAVAVWLCLAGLVLSGSAAFASLVRVPAFAVAVFLATNPYYVLNWRGLMIERAAAEGWFLPEFSVRILISFVDNSLFAGFGVTLTLLVLLAIVVQIIRPVAVWTWLYALALLLPAAIVATITANMAAWHINFRYISYLLPVMLQFLCIPRWSARPALLVLVAGLTIVQSVPMKLAYFDENDPTHSTRMLSAEWIDRNIPADEPICVTTDTLVPYEIPPFRFDQRRVRNNDCRWRVVVERETDSVRLPPGETIAARFSPRLSPAEFPLVWGHINPQVTIYRRDG